MNEPRHIPLGNCPKCGYDMDPHGTCPECGADWLTESRKSRIDRLGLLLANLLAVSPVIVALAMCALHEAMMKAMTRGMVPGDPRIADAAHRFGQPMMWMIFVVPGLAVILGLWRAYQQRRGIMHAFVIAGNAILVGAFAWFVGLFIYCAFIGGI